MVIWRAWVLFPERRWVMAGPLFFLFTTVGEIRLIRVIQLRSLTHMLRSASVFTVAYLVPYSMSMLSPDILTTILTCAFVASMVTNLLATLLIAYKLWLVNISSDVRVNDDCWFLTGTTENSPAILVWRNDGLMRKTCCSFLLSRAFYSLDYKYVVDFASYTWQPCQWLSNLITFN